MAPHQVRALEREARVGMIVRVGDLTVGNPHDGLVRLTPRESPSKYRSIDAVTDVARRTLRRYRSTIAEQPRVGRRATITGSMTVTNDERVRCGAYEILERFRVKVHRARLIDHDHPAVMPPTLGEGASMIVGKKTSRITQRGTRGRRPRSTKGSDGFTK